jgi:RNA polymerase sigma factor (sigma-70 family)
MHSSVAKQNAGNPVHISLERRRARRGLSFQFGSRSATTSGIAYNWRWTDVTAAAMAYPPRKTDVAWPDLYADKTPVGYTMNLHRPSRPDPMKNQFPGSSSVLTGNEEVNGRWFAQEVHVHDAQLRAFIRREFPRVEDVDDVVQESYLQIWKARAKQPIRSAKAFLFTVARHVALNLVRRARTSPVDFTRQVTDTPAPAGGDVAEAFSRAEIVALLVEALASLPPRCREITILRKLKGIPQRDIATTMQLSEKTVEAHVAHGVKRCEDFLRKRGIHSLYSR